MAYRFLRLFVFIVALVFYSAALYLIGPWEDLSAKDLERMKNLGLSFPIVVVSHDGSLSVTDIDAARPGLLTGRFSAQIPLRKSFASISDRNIPPFYKAERIDGSSIEVIVSPQSMHEFRYRYADGKISSEARKVFNEFFLLAGALLALLTAWLLGKVVKRIKGELKGPGSI